MEIGNNITSVYKPVFGMALKKPIPAHMEQFTEMIIGKGFASRGKKGLEKIVKEQANNKHFDIEYMYVGNKHNFTLSPTSDKAKEIYGRRGDKYIVGETKYPNILRRFRDKYESNEYKETYKSSSAIKKLEKRIEKFFAGVKAFGTVLFNPVETMPAALRKASAEASTRAKKLDELISLETKTAAKKARNQKMMETVFDEIK